MSEKPCTFQVREQLAGLTLVWVAAKVIPLVMKSLMTDQLACQYSWEGRGRMKRAFSSTKVQKHVVHMLTKQYSRELKVPTIVKRLSEWLKHGQQRCSAK